MLLALPLSPDTLAEETVSLEVNHGRTSPGVEELARRLTEKWRAR